MHIPGVEKCVDALLRDVAIERGGGVDNDLALCRWGVNPKLHRATFFQNGAKSGFEMCFGPSTLGAGEKYAANPE